MMNEYDTYILPNISLINPISKRFTYNQRFTLDELPVCKENIINKTRPKGYQVQLSVATPL